MTQVPAVPIQGITEDDIANYLANTPGFFERHAELLASVQLANPHGTRAVSLQQRQMDMLRDRIKGLEKRIIEMIRNAHENTRYVDHLHDWTVAIMLAADRRKLPDILTSRLAGLFEIPHVAVRLWDVDASLADAPFAIDVSAELRQFADGLDEPYCGANTGFEAARWCLPASAQSAVSAAAASTESTEAPASDASPTASEGHHELAHVASLAMIPLRRVTGPAFGLLVLGSPDPTRYRADIGTDLLLRIGELASASLGRLLPAQDA